MSENSMYGVNLGKFVQDDPPLTERIQNTIITIAPYKWNGIWVFDDPRVGLDHEAFVAGADTMISMATTALKIPDPEKGFLMQFSAEPFPDAQMTLTYVGPGTTGSWYYCNELHYCGWLCGALFKYYRKAPDYLWVRLLPKPPE